MANFVSPGVYVVEQDNSTYVPSINPSVVGIVGFASKGPIDKATLITDADNLVRTFGDPDEDITGQGLEGALEILETTNSLYFVRCASGAVEAEVDVALGSCPGVVLSGFDSTASSVYLKVNGTDENGVALFSADKQITLTTTGTTDAAIQAGLDSAFGTGESAKLIGVADTSAFLTTAFAGAKASLSVTSYEDSSFSTATSGIVKLDKSGITAASPVSSTTIWGMDLDATGPSYLAKSLYGGAGYNYLVKPNGSVRGLQVQVASQGGTESQLRVLDYGAQVESFRVGLVDGDYAAEDVINTAATDDATSRYIQAEMADAGADITFAPGSKFTTKLVDLGFTTVDATGLSSATAAQTDVNPRFIKLKNGTYSLAGGTNGIPTADNDVATTLIGTDTAAGKTGMKALDDDLLGISIAAVPGNSDQSVQNALITLAEDTGNFLAVVSPPYNVGTVQDAIDWSNGLSTGRTAAINSSWAAIYWPWVKVFNAYDGKDRWYDPAIYGIRQMCFTDSVAGAWFAPAGFVRARLTKPTEVEVRVGQGDRDAMYSGGNAVNPIVNFPQQGMVIFGQRTAKREPSALDRVNVRRLMIVIKKLILQSTRGLVFEPNDPLTWATVTSLAQSLLAPIAAQRGLRNFKVVCDATTNTPERVEKNELWCKVFVTPTKSAEIIVFELNLTSQSEA